MDVLLTSGPPLILFAFSIFFNKVSQRFLSINTSLSTVYHDTKKSSKVIEVCLSDADSAYEAWCGGANSIELCSDRAGGGVTPSIGMIKQCVERLKGKVSINVLIRPRLGDFVYNDYEFQIIIDDILAAKEAGVDGVVVGALLESGDIDVERALDMRRAASGISITFHRAYDICRNQEQALKALLSLKYDRLLTSGGQASALKGMLALRDIVETSGGKLTIVAAAGISAENAAIIVAGTGVTGTHAGSSVMSTCRNINVQSSASNVTMGLVGNNNDDLAWSQVDRVKTREYVNSANKGFESRMTDTKMIGLL